jgi:hypothetical protein
VVITQANIQFVFPFRVIVATAFGFVQKHEHPRFKTRKAMYTAPTAVRQARLAVGTTARRLTMRT